MSVFFCNIQNYAEINLHMVKIRLVLTGYTRQGPRPKHIISCMQQTSKSLYESLQFEILTL